MITKYSSLPDYLNYWNSKYATPLSSVPLRKERDRSMRKYLIPATENLFLDNLSSEAIMAVRRKLESAKGMTDTTLFILLRILRQALQYAYEQMLICNRYEEDLFSPTPARGRAVTYKPGEIQAIFTALRNHPLGNYYRLIYFVGLRECEAKAIRISDIDDDIIHIRRKMAKDGTVSELMDTRRRDIRLSSLAKATIEETIAIHEKRKTNPSWKKSGNDLLFTDTKGNPISCTRITDVRKLITIVTGIKDFSAAALRYTAIEAALSSGLSEKAVQDYFGYSRLSYVYSVEGVMEDRTVNGNNGSWRTVSLLSEESD